MLQETEQPGGTRNVHNEAGPIGHGRSRAREIEVSDSGHTHEQSRDMGLGASWLGTLQGRLGKGLDEQELGARVHGGCCGHGDPSCDRDVRARELGRAPSGELREKLQAGLRQRESREVARAPAWEGAP